MAETDRQREREERECKALERREGDGSQLLPPLSFYFLSVKVARKVRFIHRVHTLALHQQMSKNLPPRRGSHGLRPGTGNNIGKHFSSRAVGLPCKGPHRIPRVPRPLTSSDRRRLTSWAWLMSFSFRLSTCQHRARGSVSLTLHCSMASPVPSGVTQMLQTPRAPLGPAVCSLLLPPCYSWVHVRVKSADKPPTGLSCTRFFQALDPFSFLLYFLSPSFRRSVHYKLDLPCFTHSQPWPPFGCLRLEAQEGAQLGSVPKSRP